MFKFVIKKGPRKPLAMVIAVIIIFGAWLLTIMMTKKDVNVLSAPEKNKLKCLATDISFYIWKRPKPMEEPKYTYIQRLWNYLH